MTMKLASNHETVTKAVLLGWQNPQNIKPVRTTGS